MPEGERVPLLQPYHRDPFASHRAEDADELLGVPCGWLLDEDRSVRGGGYLREQGEVRDRGGSDVDDVWLLLLEHLVQLAVEPHILEEGRGASSDESALFDDGYLALRAQHLQDGGVQRTHLPEPDYRYFPRKRSALPVPPEFRGQLLRFSERLRQP